MIMGGLIETEATIHMTMIKEEKVTDIIHIIKGGKMMIEVITQVGRTKEDADFTDNAKCFIVIGICLKLRPNGQIMRWNRWELHRLLAKMHLRQIQAPWYWKSLK
mmetsp:Transcript_3988/g.5412  ORF Transcript_3988/g.5412 Transcript_3988/m.5412 type:complete len:105 (-) Transcript_3988:36-350(-)